MKETKKLVDIVGDEVERLEKIINEEKDPCKKQALELYEIGYLFVVSFCCYVSEYLKRKKVELNDEKK